MDCLINGHVIDIRPRASNIPCVEEVALSVTTSERALTVEVDTHTYNHIQTHTHTHTHIHMYICSYRSVATERVLMGNYPQIADYQDSIW